MSNIFIMHPFSAAQVFICHSCEDHQYSDYLAGKLSKEFDVWYSCSGSMLPADPIIPREELVRSDLVLFLGSKNSMAKKSVSAAEFSISQILQIKGFTNLCIIALENYHIPPAHSDLLFERLRWKSRLKDCQRIINAIRKRLSQDVGFTTRKDPLFGRVIFGGKDLAYLLDAIKIGKGTPFLLNAPMRHLEMTRLIEGIDAMGKRDKDHSIEFLRRVYFDAGDEALVARQNAVFVLGKVARYIPHATQDFKRQYPQFDQPFLFRGFHIGLSYNQPKIMESYMESLESERTRAWQEQRKMNRDFHLLYYGGKAAVLNELRESISQGRPRTLLRLNTFTLGEFSSAERDIKLLEDANRHLSYFGVPIDTIRTAIRKIRRRR